MKQLFVSQILVEVESLKELLDKAGIPCTIRNQQGSSLAGVVPFVEVFPELWVVNDADFDRAKGLLEEQASGDDIERPIWVCSGCGEKHAGLFTACWKCGRENDAKSEARTGAFLEVKGTPDRWPVTSDLVKGVALGVAVTLIAFLLRSYFLLQSDDTDRNGDGRPDVIFVYDGNMLVSAKYDNDFDGYFEAFFTYDRNGDTIKGTIDRYRTGKPDIIQHYTHGKTDSVEYFDRETGKMRKRATYKFDVKVQEEIDQDGDGKLEKVIKFDEYENPLP